MRGTLLIALLLLGPMLGLAPTAQAGTQVKALVSMWERCPLEHQVDLDRCSLEERTGVAALWEVEACADSPAVVEYVVLSRQEQHHETVALGAGQCLEREGITYQQVGDCMTVIVTVATPLAPTEHLRGTAEDTECAVAAYGDVVNTEGLVPLV